jgi:hypothetical protein
MVGAIGFEPTTLWSQSRYYFIRIKDLGNSVSNTVLSKRPYSPAISISSATVTSKPAAIFTSVSIAMLLSPRSTRPK